MGVFAKRKNIEDMLGASRSFLSDFSDYELILVGKDSDVKVSELIKDFKRGSIILWHYADRKDLLCLYNCAEFLLFVSFEEGFGIPSLGALSCGCQVLLSDIEVLDEIFGEAALYCDHKNPDNISNSIQILAFDPKRRKWL